LITRRNSFQFCRRKTEKEDVQMSWTQKDKVVVPVDLSEFSFSAVNAAKDFVQDNSGLHVIHVVREINPNLAEGYLGKACQDERPQICEQALEKKLLNEYPGVQIRVESGEPGEAIADYAESVDADLIVMTSHGRKGVKEHLIGSVAERVLRLARCPVLTLKPHKG
jgi:nucleotide-binding universal stress UspA family protein